VIPPVVSAGWLREHPAAVPADVRWYLDGRSGREAYEAGHLPGAVFVDLDRDLAAGAGPLTGRHPLPSPEHVAAALGRLGLGDDAVVVGYDDAGGTIAARLVWMLRVTGHDAALLDGGLAAWDGPLSTEPGDRPPAVRTPRPWPADRLADLAEATGPDVLLLDVRAPERYRGEVEPVDPRAGHVPGARSLPCRDSLGEDGRFLPADQLRDRFADAGMADRADVVASCGSGVTACHTLLAMEHAGLPPGRLWPGSWSQYSADPARPAAVGD
jgi:thiosulfate/3-mercaptopyruvate sulfurtransferase